MINSKQLGNLGEKIAQNYLKKKRYKILTENFKRKWGEIDIVAKKKDAFVFFEVKTLRLASLGHSAEPFGSELRVELLSRSPQGKPFFPEDAIDWQKKRQLIKMAQIYLSENNTAPDTPWQIDIIAIEITPHLKKTIIRHYKNAIEDIY